ncbi:hypothetical protein IE4803_PB00119 (plasmid) [Rhizobium etli bv. phaseoli str. IE4803]|nr:hypothetical protein IE4803_PB00119 [Rhizobium etli bv. phaseoli str. IE4803]
MGNINSEKSRRTLSKRYGIDQRTVAKWKKRTSLAHLTTSPKDPHTFEHICATNDIERRPTKVKHPWTNGQVETEPNVEGCRRQTLLP